MQDKYKKFTRENKKTASYLVKEFEMKKALAIAYKSTSTDKLIIDPLKLPRYKHSDDILKRLTIIPDKTTHIDVNGLSRRSMSDCLKPTVNQLINLQNLLEELTYLLMLTFY